MTKERLSDSSAFSATRDKRSFFSLCRVWVVPFPAVRIVLPHRKKILLDNFSFHDRINLEKRRKEVIQGEIDSEQQSSC